MAAAQLTPIRQRIWVSSLPELFVLLLAALPRLWRLEYHSIWFDEAVSLGWARTDPAHIWQYTFHLSSDKHPPAYYLALHYWQTLLGPFGAAERDAALRFFGVLIGILMVWGVLRLVTQLSGRGNGLIAGSLTALAPLLVWYSQELRMFQPAATAVVWAAFFLVAARERFPPHDTSPGRGAAVARLLCWLGLIATLLLALYSYLYAAFFLPGLGLSVLLLARRGGSFDRRFFFEASAALAVVAALFFPLARNAWAVNSASSMPGAAFADFLPNLWRQLRIFTVWLTGWPSAFRTAAILFFAVLVLAGLILPGNTRRTARPLLWLWIGGPLLIGSALLATNAAIFREDRYFLFLAPFVLSAAAQGVGAIARWRSYAGLFSGLAAVAAGRSAAGPVDAPTVPRELARRRRLYQRLSAAQPSLGHGRARPPLLPVPGTGLVPASGRRNSRVASLWQLWRPADARAGGNAHRRHLQEMTTTNGADTLWLAQSHLAGVDDHRLVQAWLDSNFALITEQYPAGVELRGYAVRYRYPTLPPLPETAVYPDAQLFPGVELAACEIITPVVPARDVLYHPPSGWVHLRLWLRAFDVVSEAPELFALAQADDGQVWGRSLQRAGDVLTVYPPTMWQPGEFVRVELDVNLNPLAPPGTYNVKVEAAGEPGVPCGKVQLE